MHSSLECEYTLLKIAEIELGFTVQSTKLYPFGIIQEYTSEISMFKVSKYATKITLANISTWDTGFSLRYSQVPSILAKKIYTVVK